MRTRIKVTDLTEQQWRTIQESVQTGYDFPAGTARACVVFELAPMVERHIEMPMVELATLLDSLETQAATASAILTPDAEPAHTCGEEASR